MKILLAPANVLLRLIEEGVRPLSLSLRLFGNLYAGELIFVLIALMTLNSSLAHFSTYLMGTMQFISGFAWTAFQIGRASCRDRVCQYVKFSVVAVSLKK